MPAPTAHAPATASRPEKPPKCDLCGRRDDQELSERGLWRCFNPPCQYARALARVPALMAAVASLLLLLAASASAQIVVPSTNSLAVVWDAPMDPATGLADYVEYYLVKQGAQPGGTIATQRVDSGREYRFVPADPSKVYYFRVAACKVVRSGGKDVEACAPDSNEANTSAFVGQPPIPPVDVCAVPLGEESISAVVTGWKATSGRPGSKMRVDYQLASKSPIVQVSVKLNDQIVTTQSGADLRESAGQWMIAPASGIYKLAIYTKNAFGCQREAPSQFNLVVK